MVLSRDFVKTGEMYDDYLMVCEEGTEVGIFFRSPIQVATFMDYITLEGSGFDIGRYINEIKNPIRRVFETLLGNKDVVNTLLHDDDIADVYKINVLCSPLYFRRRYRKLECNARTDSCKGTIGSIRSYGYDTKFEAWCAGVTHSEKTHIRFKHNLVKKTKIRIKKKSYRYTYKHVIEDVMKNDKF